MVKSAIRKALFRAEGVLREPEPLVRLTEINQDHLVYTALFAVNRRNAALTVSDAVLSAIWYQFLERDIAIPEPGRRLSRAHSQHHEATPEQLAALAEVELLSGLNDAERDMLIRASVIRRYAPGQTIIVQGSAGATMSIVLAGEVAVLVDGRELARLSRGHIFGEMALLTGAPRMAEIRATAPTRCLEVDREGFRMKFVIILTTMSSVRSRLRKYWQWKGSETFFPQVSHRGM